MKIDKTNYMDATIGKFKSIPWNWAKALATVGMYTPCYLGGRIWKLDHVGYGKNGDHFSGYWISDDGKHLIRISDQWSMKQKPHVVEVDCQAKKGRKVAGGCISFDKMKKL